MRFRMFMAGATVACLAVATALRATTLPETYPLGEADEAPNVDPNLVEWLAQHVEQPSPLAMPMDKFDAFLAKQDQLTGIYLRLARLAAEPEKDGPRPLVDQALKLLASDQDSSKPAALNHPLLPFLYLELLRSGVLTAEERAKTGTAFRQEAAGTCAAKHALFDELSRDNLAALSEDDLRGLLDRIGSYRSAEFKKAALRHLASDLPETRRASVGDRLQALLEPYPAVRAGIPWLARLPGKDGKVAPAKDPQALFDMARQLAGKRLCSKAKEILSEALGKVKREGGTAQDAVTAAKAIDGCYRSRDPQLRTEFWKSLTAQMTDTYGFDGWAESKLRLGFIYWSHNDFSEAKALFQEVLGKTDGKYRAYEARAVFALARIAENETEPDKAADLYKEYLSRFADQENFEEALMAYVLIHVDKNEWEPALAPLESLIQAQTQLPPDERSTGALSFAMFWAGRIYVEQSRLKEAGEMWRRVATEYYSTYYGAMGHYLLEKLSGRKLALSPSRTPPFRMHALREAFAPQDQLKVKRVEELMRLGLHHEAVCELDEIDTADGRPEKLLVKALMMHAAGLWLDAIKAYDALPRSFRSTLAIGFERILFPRRYQDEVRALAAKAGIDPDLVMAIIRQESVFNPVARSPVGAMGLMQLMPATAALELKRVEGGYLSAGEKRQIRQNLGNPLSLLVAETNLAIGVHHVRTLLDSYHGPVFVLSAYNASPAAAHKWMTTIPTKDVLAFIEKIPYKETRAYVKLVLRNYFYYKRWYGNVNDSLIHLDAVASPLLAEVAAGGKVGVGPPAAPAEAAAASAATPAPAKAAPNH